MASSSMVINEPLYHYMNPEPPGGLGPPLCVCVCEWCVCVYVCMCVCVCVCGL